MSSYVKGFTLLCPPLKCVFSVGDSRFIQGCGCVLQGGCAHYTRTYPHTASVTLVISFYKMLTLSSLCCMPFCSLCRDPHAEQSAHMLVCLGFARCWEDPLLQQNREVTVQAPFNWSMLSGAKQTIWYLDLVQSEHIEGKKNVLNGVFWSWM